MLDGATFLETLCPQYPTSFLLIASVANIAKNIGFLTASASRAALHQSMVKNGNLGDITAKAGSQSTAASLLGTTIGICLSPIVGNDSNYIMFSVIFLSAIHIFLTYQSLRYVSLRSLNRTRIDILFQRYFQTIANNEAYVIKHSQFTPQDVSQMELMWPFQNRITDHILKVGCPLSELCPLGITQLKFLYGLTDGDEKYILSCSITCDSQRPLQVQLTFLENARWIDVLRGMAHAHAFCVHHSTSVAGAKRVSNQCTESEIIIESYVLMKKHFNELLTILSTNGWDMEEDHNIIIEDGDAVRLRVYDEDAEK